MKLSDKDKNKIRDALTSAFSRSDLRKSVIDENVVTGYHDPNRPRVKSWVRCELCKQLDAKSYSECDHIDPKVPVDQSYLDIGPHQLLDRLFCDKSNLQALCTKCHLEKTNKEKAERKAHRKAKKERSKVA